MVMVVDPDFKLVVHTKYIRYVILVENAFLWRPGPEKSYGLILSNCINCNDVGHLPNNRSLKFL